MLPAAEKTPKPWEKGVTKLHIQGPMQDKKGETEGKLRLLRKWPKDSTGKRKKHIIILKGGKKRKGKKKNKRKKAVLSFLKY